MSNKLTPRETDYSKWYNEIVVQADLAENSAIRGCMIIKPYGYAIWEKMQAELDKMFKATGHENAYFPLFVPKSLFEAEEKNAEGFAKECAVVTHYRLKNDDKNPGKLIVDENAKVDEEATDKRLMAGPLGLANHRCTSTFIFATGSDMTRDKRELALLLARDVVSSHGDGVFAGVTSPHPRVVVMRALSPLVEPTQTLFRAVWAAWRTGLWEIKNAPPRIWAM